MKHCYLIGYPVSHSLSPVMHNAAFKRLGLDITYSLAPVEPGRLGAYVNDLRRDDFLGASVTIPHKVEVIRHLDTVDATASAIGAVNTIVHGDGRLEGYNTDATGAVKALREEYGELEGAEIVVLGAGGASRAVCYQLSRMDCSLTILNRTADKARRLADSIRDASYARIKCGGLAELGERIGGADILVNATPVGMSPEVNASPVPFKLLRPGLFVYDVIYNPLNTKLLIEAQTVGARTLGGARMLVYQGAEAFQMWTGREAPVETMLEAVLSSLGGRRR
ncbi:shikimate dehydrogenase [Candidatus Bathyarchaeota archaeon]|nr:shikimate dehydrogenase [Candidatus Bathyarchaeota archaeon]